MSLPNDAISLDQNSQQQSNGLPADAISLDSGTTAGTQSIAMGQPQPVSNTPPMSPNYTPGIMDVKPMLNPGLAANLAGAQAGAEAQAKIIPNIQQKTGELQAENVVGAARQVAEEQTNLDIFTQGLREATKDIGRAYIQGMAGGTVQNLYGTAAEHGLVPGSSKSGQKAYGAYESLKSTMIPQLNSIYSTQFGGKDPSTRMMTSLLDLGKQELPAMDKTLDANEGQINTSLTRFATLMQGSLNYLKNNYTAQQLAAAYKNDPKILDQYVKDAFDNSKGYQFSAQALQGVQDRINEVRQPLEYAKRGYAIYDMPQKDGSVQAVPVKKADVDDFEKRNNL